MVAHEHELLIELVRHRPSLVATLLAEVGLKVPAYEEARLVNADLNDCRRGLDLADEARERILGCTDQQVLESWIHKAVTIECVDELFD